jgi:hypothetical protein
VQRFHREGRKMIRTMLGFAVVIGCSLLLMPLLVDLDPPRAGAAPAQQLAAAELAPHR